MINHFAKTAVVIDNGYLAKYYHTSESEILESPCGVDVVRFTTLKTIIFGKYGYSIDKLQYNIACRKSKKLDSLNKKQFKNLKKIKYDNSNEQFTR